VDDLVVDGLVIPADDLDERFETSGGPGGQHANRSSTAVVLRLDLTKSSLPADVRQRLIGRLGAVVETRAADHRSQARNRDLARQRMAERISAALVEEKPRRRTRPTRASRERRRKEKATRSEVKRMRRRPRDPEG
jgi:ribosome-associated protein